MTDPTRPLLSVSGLDVFLGSGTRRVRILQDVSFDVAEGTTVGLVGESGSGKSTLAKALVGVHRADSGSIRFDGEEISRLGGRARANLYRRIQLIPQDPYSSLNPRRTVAQTLAEAIDPRRASVSAHRDRIQELLELVWIDSAASDRYPREFSGGQRQRIAIARALAVEPSLIIADEITSALDVSTQAEVLRLLADLKSRLQLTLIFVSHNLAVVRQISDDVLVLYHGEVVEHGTTAAVFENPVAPYTRTLIDSVPGGPAFRLD